MPSDVATASDIMADMAKKKQDRHVTKRVATAIPEPWHAVARKLAAKRQQPVVYLIISLLQAEAEKQGVGDLPAPPWEEEDANSE